MGIRKLTQKDLEYGRKVSLEFAEENYKEWFKFHTDVMGLVEQGGLESEVDLFVDASNGRPDLANHLRNAKTISIASENLKPSIYHPEIAQAIEDAITQGSDVKIYLGRMLGEHGRALYPGENTNRWQFSMPLILPGAIEKDNVHLHIVQGKVPVDLMMTEGMLEYLDPITPFTRYVSRTRIKLDEAVQQCVNSHLSKLNSLGVNQMASVPQVSYAQLTAETLRMTG